VARRQRRVVSVCYDSWRDLTTSQRQTKSTLYKFIGRLSNMLLWSAFEGWRDSAHESRRCHGIVQRVLVRMTQQNLSAALSRCAACRVSNALRAAACCVLLLLLAA
jgi:hypothetical protein